MYIDANTIITISAVLAALGGIGGVVVWCIKFVDRQKKQDKELAAIRKEQTLICYGVLACLKGLKEQELSKVALAEIIVPVAVYAFKSGVENLSKNNRWPDKGDTPEAEPEDTDPPGMG